MDKDGHEIIVKFCSALWRIVSEGKKDPKTKKPYLRIISNLGKYWEIYEDDN